MVVNRTAADVESGVPMLSDMDMPAELAGRFSAFYAAMPEGVRAPRPAVGEPSAPSLQPAARSRLAEAFWPN